MSRKGIHRIVIALALAAALQGMAAPLAAQPHGPAFAAAPLRLGVDALRAWARLWLGLPGTPAARNKGGSSIDPNGLQTSSPPPATNGDGGLQIDPNG
jgi:hypothetical protein